jgi:uncharacterized protein YuzE
MMTRGLGFRYDDRADAAYIYLVPRGADRVVARTRFCNVEFDGAAINVDLDADNRILGFEILGASKVLHASLLEPETDPPAL